MVSSKGPLEGSRQPDFTDSPRILAMQEYRSTPGNKIAPADGPQEQNASSDLVDLNKGQIAYRSPSMKVLIDKAKRFANSSATVLVTGESGTGKELFSRLIHEYSPRSKQRYVAVNCAAMPEMLIESELFGHERGAFTGAFQQRIGHFQLAHQGTILLDEISEIPANIQAKLLRTIEEQEIQRIGSTQTEQIDVRIIATSNRDLRKETADGSFRLDLFHRLNVLELEIPPLRERVEDILPLAEYFIEYFRSESHHQIHGITKPAMDKLCQYTWPGNIRELRNVVHRATVICNERKITVDCLPPLASESTNLTRAGKTIAEVERQMILDCLKKYDGNKSLAAEELGVTTRTINNKLKLYREQLRNAG
jgi:transcriptional regulator with PAS, ATPase and Fis domain